MSTLNLLSMSPNLKWETYEIRHFYGVINTDLLLSNISRSQAVKMFSVRRNLCHIKEHSVILILLCEVMTSVRTICKMKFKCFHWCIFFDLLTF